MNDANNVVLGRSVFRLMQDYVDAAEIINSGKYPGLWSDERMDRFEAWAKFIRRNTHHLQFRPDLFLPLALSQPQDSMVLAEARGFLASDGSDLTNTWLRAISSPNVDPSPGLRQTLVAGRFPLKAVAFWPPPLGSKETLSHPKYCISGDDMGAIFVWNFSTGELERTIAAHRGSICSIQFPSMTNLGVSIDQLGTISQWNIINGEIISQVHFQIPADDLAKRWFGAKKLALSFGAAPPLMGDFLVEPWTPFLIMSPRGDRFLVHMRFPGIFGHGWTSEILIFDTGSASTPKQLTLPLRLPSDYPTTMHMPRRIRKIDSEFFLDDSHLAQPMQVVFAGFSAQGEEVVLISESGEVSRWHTGTGTSLGCTTVNDFQKITEENTPHGQLFAKRSDVAFITESKLIVVDLISNTTTSQANWDSKLMTHVASSEHKKLLFFEGKNNILMVFEPAIEPSVSEFVGHSAKINDAVVSSCGRFVASCADDSSVKIWRLSDTRDKVQVNVRNVKSAELPFGDGNNLLIEKLGERVFFISQNECGRKHHDGFVLTANERTNRNRETVSPTDSIPNSGVDSCTAIGKEQVTLGSRWHSRSGTLFATKIGETCFSVGNYRDASFFQVFESHYNTVKFVAFSDSGDELFSASDDRTMSVWRTSSGQCTKIVKVIKKGLTKLYPLSRTQAIIAGDEEGNVLVWNNSYDAQFRHLFSIGQKVTGLSAAAHADVCVVGGLEGRVVLFSPMSGVLKGIFSTHHSSVTDIDLSSCGRMCVWVDDGHSIFVGSATGKLEAVHPVDYFPVSIRFLPNSPPYVVAVGASSGDVYFFQIEGLDTKKPRLVGV